MNQTTINPKLNQNRRRFIIVSNNNISVPDCHFTSRATLLALGLKVEHLKIMETVGHYVSIAQKTVKDSPLDKLTDALITILAGGRGLVEANKRVRADRALQRAFGRERCAEQSVISETLNACTRTNVQQMSQALTELYRQHSAGYHHNYQQQWQLLDIDLSGQPCGPKAAFASKGYFAHQRNRRGRQLGRVWASWYQEIVVDQIYPGNTTLHSVLPDLLKQAEQVLALDLPRRQRTILRIDSHGGSLHQVNELLRQGYQVHTKEGNWRRAQQSAASVKIWHDDPRVPGRQVGWVTLPASDYVRPVQRIAVRTRKKNGQWGLGVVLSTLSATVVTALVGFLPEQMNQPLAQMFAYVYFYDLRAGGIEIGLKEDKQGLGITKRNKQSLEAQQMLTCLNLLAHNLLIWFQQWLAQRWSAVTQLGLLRFIRDVLHISGGVFFGREPAGIYARL
jgi:hypothetical protein